MEKRQSISFSLWTRSINGGWPLLLVAAIGLWSQTMGGQRPPLQRLTLAQIEGLVSHGVPDPTMAAQIKLRGVTFTPTAGILDELRANGAGPQTLATIQAAPVGAPVEQRAPSPHLPVNGAVQQSSSVRNWAQNSPIPVLRGSTLDQLRENEIWEGGQYGLGTERIFGHLAAVFSAANSSRIEYGGYIASQGEGTLEIWIQVNHGYRYDNFQFEDNLDDAIIFSSDCAGGDVTWPGATKLTVNANGDISLWMAVAEGNQPPAQPTMARGTPFRFGEWHAIGISYGSLGQWIMLDGQIVAASPTFTQTLGRAGNHQQPLDQATIGETACHFWRFHQYEGGFDGVVAGVRLSTKQKDWALALARPSQSAFADLGQTENESAGSDAAPPRAARVSISAAVAESMLLERIQPIYPPIAKAARVAGTVALDVTVSGAGTVKELHVISGPALLQDSAINAVKEWRYRPYLLNNKPVEFETTAYVTFTPTG